jgi:hypothetical protein
MIPGKKPEVAYIHYSGRYYLMSIHSFSSNDNAEMVLHDHSKLIVKGNVSNDA